MRLRVACVVLCLLASTLFFGPVAAIAEEPGTTAATPAPTIPPIITAYAITFGWALVASLSVGVGIIIALKLFDLSTPNVDEWELIKQGNMPMAVVLAAMIVSIGLVISSAIRP